MNIRFATLVLFTAMVSSAFGATNRPDPQRFDLSPENDRRDHLSTNRTNWLVNAEKRITFKSGDVEFTFEPIGKSKDGIQTDWWKAGLVHDALMASDGI